jgi:hypothetical protein
LGIRLSFNPDLDILRYTGRDAGCRKNAVDLLRVPQNTHRHAILFFDRHGCGDDEKSCDRIVSEIENQLHSSGWETNCAAVIVFDPELEAWTWSDSPKVADILGWKGDIRALKAFIRKKNLLKAGENKPADPKEAMRTALRYVGRPCTAPVFSELAEKVSVRGCNDPSFNKFSKILQRWFPQD